MIRTFTIHKFFFRLEGFATSTIESDIFFLIDITSFHKFCPKLLRSRIVYFLVRSPEKGIIRYEEFCIQFFEYFYILIQKRQNILSFLLGSTSIFDTMFISSCLENNIFPQYSINPDTCIRLYDFQSMSHMRSCIWIRDSSSYIEFFHHFL